MAMGEGAAAAVLAGAAVDVQELLPARVVAQEPPAAQERHLRPRVAAGGARAHLRAGADAYLAALARAGGGAHGA